MKMKKKNYSVLTIVVALALCCAVLAGCGQKVTLAAETTIPAVVATVKTEAVHPRGSGVLILKVNPEIAVSYDEAGSVTDVAGRNPEGKAIVMSYSNFKGKDCRTVISELVSVIADAGYFVDSVDGEERTITIELEAGAEMPDNAFLEDIVTEVETNIAENRWNTAVKSNNTAGEVDAMASATPIAGAVDAATSATPTTGAADAMTPATYAGPADTDIGAEEAKRIALQHADVAASTVTFARAERDYDDGRWVYEVEFYSQNKEYDYEIDASTGSVLRYDYDVENYATPTADAGNNTSHIGIDQAKAIALKHAGLSESDVSFSKAKFEDDHGRKEYEIEFYCNGTEYEYSIDAASGSILDYDSERDD